MKVKISPSRLCGEISAPPSKSYAHRLMICAALAEGESTIHGISESEDMLATLDCIAALGARYEKFGRSASGISPAIASASVPSPPRTSRYGNAPAYCVASSVAWPRHSVKNRLTAYPVSDSSRSASGSDLLKPPLPAAGFIIIISGVFIKKAVLYGG